MTMIKLFPVTILLVIVGVLVATELVMVKSQQTQEENELICKELMQNMTKRQFKGLSECKKTLVFKDKKEKARKFNCIIKCLLEKENIVGKDGYIGTEKVAELIAKELPAFLNEIANKTFTPCIELANGKLDPNLETDPFCETYEDPIQCTVNGLSQLCQEYSKNGQASV